MKRLFKKLILRVFIALIALGLLAIPALYLIALNSPTVSAAWFNDNWGYRTSYSINNTGSAVTNQKVKLDIDTSTLITNSKLQSDCDDSRFTDQNGKLLDYFIDTNEANCNNASTDYYVTVPTINSSTTIIYHYYGNPQASKVRKDDFLPPPSASTLGVGLKGYWKLDEPSGTRSDYAHTNNLTDNNTVTQATGKVGNAAQFTSANSESLSITDNADLSTGDVDFSVAAWTYLDTKSSNRTVIGKFKYTGSNDREYLLDYDSTLDQFRWIVSSNGNDTTVLAASTFGSLSTSTWYFLVAWHDATNNQLGISVNGVSDTSSYASGVYNSAAQFELGRRDHGQITANYMDGRIDGVGVWKKVLTAAERTALYNSGSGVDFTSPITFFPSSTSTSSEEKAPSPAAYWKFDDSQGQTAQDSTTNNNDGTLGATSGVEASDPTWQTEDMCVSGKCLKFDGTDDYVNVSNTVSGTQTVEMWVRPTSSTAPLITLNGTTNVSATSGTISATGFDSPTIYVNGKVSSTLTANTWQHVAITTGTAISASTIKIGNVSTSYITGFIDEVKIYPYARSAAQILADYNSRGNNEGTSAVFGQVPSSKFQVLSDGLVGYWKMDEASANSCSGGVNDNCDSSGNGNNGAWNGNATSAAGKYGNGTTYDGTGDYTDMTDPSTGILDFSDSFTISAWVKTSQSLAAGNYAAIAGKGYLATTTGYGLLLNGDNSSNVVFQVRNGLTYVIVFGGSINNGVWHHVVGVREHGTNTSKIYVDGTFVASDSSTNLSSGYSGNDRFGVGQRHLNSDDAWAHGFNGQVDEVRIYNRALSPAEISTLYNFAPGPVGYWRMDEASWNGTSGEVKDASGNGNNGTGSGGVTTTNGKYGKAGSFDGSNDFISISDATPISVGATTNSHTVGFWLNTTTTLLRYVVAKYDGIQVRYPFAFSINGTANKVSLQVYDGTNAPIVTSTATINDGSWHYISGVRDVLADKIYLYVDGVLQTSGTTDTTTSTTANNAALLAAKDTIQGGGPLYLNAKIDDIKIYNYARTQKQIIEDMGGGHPAVLAGSSGPSSVIGSGARQSGPVGYWKFDEGYSTTANNSGSGGSALNGTLTGMASPATTTSGWTQAGKFNRGLVFDGSDDKVDISDNNSLDITGQISISYWMKLATTSLDTSYVSVQLDKAVCDANTNNGFIAAFDNRSSTGATMAVEFSAGTSNNYMVKRVQNGITDTSWHNIVMTFKDAGEEMHIYIDGSDKPLNTRYDTGTAVLATNNQSLRFGSCNNGGVPFNGSLDEVKIYPYALTADEVKLDYNRGAAQVLGSLSDKTGTGYESNQSANQEYCIPGDSTTCTVPVGRWDFDEGTGSTVNDKSGNGYNGTITGATYKTGKIGKGLNFNSSTDTVSVSNTLSTKTVEFWVNPSTTTENLIDLRTAATAASISVSSGTISATGFTSPTIYVNGAVSSTLTANTWQHVAVTTGTAISASAIQFGRISSTSLTGKLDSIRFFDYARSAAQVAWDYNRGAPVAHYKFDECQGATAHDSSGNANHGTLTIGASGTQTSVGTCTGSANTAWKDGATGKFNSSLDLDGTDDYVTLGNPSTLGLTNAITMSSWIKTSTTASQIIINKKFSYSIFVNDLSTGCSPGGVNGSLWVLIGTGSTWSCNSTYAGYTSNSVADSNWHHIVTTFDDNTNILKVYVDGVLSVNNSSASVLFGSNSNTVTIGTDIHSGSPANSFNGQIDDVRIYNYALTPVQIRLIYNQGGAIRYGPLTGSP